MTLLNRHSRQRHRQGGGEKRKIAGFNFKRRREEEMEERGVRFKNLKGKRCSRASRKSTSDLEKEQVEILSLARITLCSRFSFSPFFLSSLLQLSTASTEMQRPSRDAIKRKLATLVYGGSAGIGLGVLCTGSGFTRFQLRIFNRTTTSVRLKHDAELSRKENVPPRGEN